MALGHPGPDWGAVGACFLTNNEILGLELCEKCFKFAVLLLATRVASGSHPSPPRSHMGWTSTPKDPEPLGACRVGHWVYFGTKTAILRTRLEWKLESVNFTILDPLESHRGQNSGQACAGNADPPFFSSRWNTGAAGGPF